MNSTTLAVESVIELGADEVFERFGTRDTGGWLFDARCASKTVGAPLRFTLPTDGHRVELLGKLSALRPGALIVVEHTQPWRGQLRVRLDPAGRGRTRLRVSDTVSAAGVDWLVRHRGVELPLPAPTTGATRIGLVVSKSGPGAVFSAAGEFLAELAVDEINASGGVGGRPLELVVADDATDPAIAAAEAHRLVRSGCRAIFACTNSLSFSAMQRAVRASDVLLVHALMNERAASRSPSVLRFGERPADQLDALAGRLMRATGGRSWFLVGLRYSWSYGSHFAARRVVSQQGGHVAGEAYVPLGTTDFAPVIEQIRRSGADLVMSSLNGAHEVDFQEQCFAAGLRERVRTLSLALDESTCEYIAPAAAEGIWTALGYVQGGPAAGNADLLARYHAAHGRWAPPISTMSETAYETIHRYARVLHRNADDGPREQGRALVADIATATGSAIGDRNIAAPGLYLTEVRVGELTIFDEVG
ncbi:MAG TPA: substrate-binding protein [Amycolatopsis sp.]|nr:substrate-binding protein [Amycolatopsis sp.]